MHLFSPFNCENEKVILHFHSFISRRCKNSDKGESYCDYFQMSSLILKHSFFGCLAKIEMQGSLSIVP